MRQAPFSLLRCRKTNANIRLLRVISLILILITLISACSNPFSSNSTTSGSKSSQGQGNVRNQGQGNAGNQGQGNGRNQGQGNAGNQGNSPTGWQSCNDISNYPDTDEYSVCNPKAFTRT